MLCLLILYISGGTYSLKSNPNDRFLEKLCKAILFTLRVFARNLLRRNRRWNSFRILFWCLAWDSNPGFSSSKPIHYLLDHGDKIRQYPPRSIWASSEKMIFLPKSASSVSRSEAYFSASFKRIHNHICSAEGYCDNFACLHTFRDQNELHLKRWFFFCQNRHLL